MKDNYFVKLTVQNPIDINECVDVALRFSFCVDTSNYGNGTYCGIYFAKSDTRYVLWYNNDLRYNTEFSNEHRMTYITNWCENYWNGKNGAFKLTYINIV